MHESPSHCADGARSTADSRGGGDTLAARALALRQAAREGRLEPLLRGKYFGLICEQQDSDDAALFHDAAVALGAQVARIRPSVARLDGLQDAARMAVWLGRLYDAVECLGLPAETVAQIRHDASMPVFDGIVAGHSATAALAAIADPAADDLPACRACVAQAVLVELFG